MTAFKAEPKEQTSAARGTAPSTPAPAAGGRKPMTPKERAQHAALVRWGKKNPLAARLMAVREARKQRKAKAAAKPKPGEGGGGAAKPKAPKPTPEQRKAEREQEKQAEQQQNRAQTFKELGLFEDATAALSDLAAGTPIDDDGGLVTMGLAEQADDGTYRLTPAGRQLYNAASRGDLGMARDTLSRAGDAKRRSDERTQQQQEKATAREQARAARQAEREKRAAEREKAKAEKDKQKAKGGGGGGKGKDETKDKEKAAKEQARQERAARVQALQLGRLERGGKLSDTQLADLEVEGLIRIDRDGVPSLTPEGKKRLAKKRTDTDEMTVSAIKQTAQERAMFANMGSSGSGGGRSGGSGGKPSGGTGGLWKRGPDGKRTPQAGLEVPKKKDQDKQGDGEKDPRPKLRDGLSYGKDIRASDVAVGQEFVVPGNSRVGTRAGKIVKIGQKNLEYESQYRGNAMRLKMPKSDLVGGYIQEGNTIRSIKNMEILMSDFGPILDDLTATLDELSEVGQEYDAIKAGRRNSDADQRTLDQAYAAAEQVCELLETLGANTGEIDPEDDDTFGGDAAMYGVSGKALDYEQAAQKVREAWYRVPMQLPMPDDRPYVVTVRDDSVIVNQGGTFYLISYTQQDGAISFAQRGDWQEVKPDYVPVSSSTKGIEVVSDDLAALPGYATKALGDGWVGGYLVKFGGEGDLSQWRDVFSKSTDFGSAKKSDVYVHHRMLPGLGKKRLKHQAEIGIDDEGVFIKHLLDLRDSYEAKLHGLAEQGKLGWSSGTAPHLVDRKALGDGRHEIQSWPLGLDASYTPTPAGGLVVNAQAMKSLFDDAGIDLLAAIYTDSTEAQDAGSRERRESVKAAADDRARRLSLQARLVALQE